MQKAILVLQIVILLIFLIVGFYFINELNKLSTEIENALLLIEIHFFLWEEIVKSNKSINSYNCTKKMRKKMLNICVNGFIVLYIKILAKISNNL